MLISKRILYRTAVLLLSFALLGGCTTILPRADGPANQARWEARQAELAAIDHWTLSGKAAIATADDGWNASVDWRQRGEMLEVLFSGPLGFGSARVTGTAEVLTVQTADGETFVTSNPEADLYWNLGWTAPIDKMRYWVIGIPAPGPLEELVVDAAGRVLLIRQAGWQVDFQDYLAVDRQAAMPRKLSMTRDDIRIRLVVGEWQIPTG